MHHSFFAYAVLLRSDVSVMTKQKPPFRADHVGSLMRPKSVLQARSKAAAKEISIGELRAIEDEEIVRLAKKQEEIGLHAITDGEIRRAFFHLDFLERLDGVTVDGMIEANDERSGGLSPLRFVPRNKTVVLGLVTSKRAELEPMRELIDRVEEAAQYVPLENLCLSPQCGFSSTLHGNDISEDAQWRKLQLVVDTAAEIWADA